MIEDPRLHTRLRSCLQTILDLEHSLGQMDVAQPILAEFAMLKEIYGRLETLLVQEEDVRRIEDATANFLFELRNALKDGAPPSGASVDGERRILQ